VGLAYTQKHKTQKTFLFQMCNVKMCYECPLGLFKIPQQQADKKGGVDGVPQSHRISHASTVSEAVVEGVSGYKGVISAYKNKTQKHTPMAKSRVT
jgi:hypothetical protein